MSIHHQIQGIKNKFIQSNNHSENDYFSAINEFVTAKHKENNLEISNHWQKAIDDTYSLIQNEITTNRSKPFSEIKFGTSGWRGLLGKDLYVHSVASVIAAILSLYKDIVKGTEFSNALGINSFEEMQKKGCLIGFDNRFGGEILAASVCNVLAANNVNIYYAGEATTGTLSAAALELQTAFSINLTPSHNPLQYGGIKYNSSDAGPASPILTDQITKQARLYITNGVNSDLIPAGTDLLRPVSDIPGIKRADALKCWQQLVRKNNHLHALDYDKIISEVSRRDDIAIAIDCVHGASRKDISAFFNQLSSERLIVLRGSKDYTFGGIAPEPSSANMQPAISTLKNRKETLKVGAIIDPDGDRIRFTDGNIEISMNEFGAMAYHFIHEIKHKKGMVAKTVATSNLANAIARNLNEETFEPKVGFKEFKPVIGKALVYFEESDGISVIGHTPEKDAYIGLLLALDMLLTLNIGLGDYLDKIKNEFGFFFPDRDGVTVSQQGAELTASLAKLDKYGKGKTVQVGGIEKTISDVIVIDGRKMLFEDGSWIMIRPSGTEPKVRFYVEGRNKEETKKLVETANSMLAEIGLLA